MKNQYKASDGGLWNIQNDGPTPKLAWSYVHDDYDGAPDAGDHRHGHAETRKECIKEIEEMIPLVDFQSHGMFHLVLPMCSEETLSYELTVSKQILQEITKKECYMFAYPYGTHNDRVVEVAKKAGYKMARTADPPGLNRLNDDPMKLKAIGIPLGATCKDLEESIAWAEIRFLAYRIFPR